MGFFGKLFDDDDYEDDRRKDRINYEVRKTREQAHNNYIRSQVIAENRERRRKGLPELPVPPGDYR